MKMKEFLIKYRKFAILLAFAAGWFFYVFTIEDKSSGKPLPSNIYTIKKIGQCEYLFFSGENKQPVHKGDCSNPIH